MSILPNEILNIICSYLSSPTNKIMKDYINENIDNYNEYVSFNIRTNFREYIKSFGGYKLSIKSKSPNLFNKYDVVVHHIKDIITRRFFQSFGSDYIIFKHKHPKMIGNILIDKYREETNA